MANLKVLLDVSENAPLMYLPLDQLSGGGRNRSNASSGSADSDEQLDMTVIERLRNTQGSSSSSSNTALPDSVSIQQMDVISRNASKVQFYLESPNRTG